MVVIILTTVITTINYEKRDFIAISSDFIDFDFKISVNIFSTSTTLYLLKF